MNLKGIDNYMNTDNEIHTYIDRNADDINIINKIRKLSIYTNDNPYKIGDDISTNKFINSFISGDEVDFDYIAISTSKIRTVSGFYKFKVLFFFLSYCGDYPDYGDKYYYSQSFIDHSRSVYLKPMEFYDEVSRL